MRIARAYLKARARVRRDTGYECRVRPGDNWHSRGRTGRIPRRLVALLWPRVAWPEWWKAADAHLWRRKARA